MKKICFFLPGLYGGGAERVLLNLAQGIAGHGYSVDFVLAQFEGALKNQIPENIRLVVLNKKIFSSFRTIRCIPLLASYLRTNKPDTLITALHGNVVAGLAKSISGSHVKLIFTEHNTFSIQNRLFSPFVARLNEILVKIIYPHAEKIVAVSEGVANDLIEVTRIPRSRVEVIMNPVITPVMLKKKNEQLSNPWFDPGSPKVILAVGRLTEQKDFSTLIRAFAAVNSARKCRLMILGEGELRSDLQALSRELGIEDRVKLPGFVDNPYAYMSNSALFVLSSRWEGLPTVLIEAMACGTPVISTNCPSGPKEILKDGGYGRLIPVGAVEELTKALEDGLDGKIPSAPVESWQPFTLENVVNQYINLVEHDS